MLIQRGVGGGNGKNKRVVMGLKKDHTSKSISRKAHKSNSKKSATLHADTAKAEVLESPSP